MRELVGCKMRVWIKMWIQHTKSHPESHCFLLGKEVFGWNGGEEGERERIGAKNKRLPLICT